MSPYSGLKIKNSKLLENIEIRAECIIKERPVIKAKWTKVEVSLPALGEGMMLYIDKSFPHSVLEVGDTIVAKLSPEIVKNFDGLGFNYSKYLAKRGIYTTSYVRTDEIVLRKLTKFTAKDRIYRVRERYISKITDLIGSGDASATLIAITIGDKSYLDPDTKNAYSASGTMHLLAVSGLHVGFIYSFLSFFLLILGNFSYSKFLRLIIIVAFLWIYVIIVGFAPSVTRAVIMATIYEICKNIERERIGLNTLALSALVITLVKPQAIFEIGFQLSFAALLSIITIHPKINKYYLPGNIFAKYIWSTMSISIACQVGTFMITLCAFGFFPTYFLLANLLAIPLSAIILYIALGQLLFLNHSVISKIITGVLRIFLELLNSCVTRIESLPYSSIVLTLNNGQIILLLVLIIIYTFDIIDDSLYKRYVCLGLVASFIMCSL